MIEGPAGRRMTDHDDLRVVERGQDVVEEAPSAIDDLAITLSVWKRLVDAPRPLGRDLRHGLAVQDAVVAFAKPRIAMDREAGFPECDLRGLDGSAQIGREDRRDVVGAPTLAELLRKPPSPFG